MTDKYTDGDYQRKVGEMVQREVVYCVSYLVSEMAKVDECFDELLPIMTKDDWETPVTWEINQMSEESDLYELGHYMLIGSDSEALENMHAEYLGLHDTGHDDEADDLLEKIRELVHECAADDYQEAADFLNVDPEQDEALEHWIVTDWLARKLEERGEMVGEFMGMTIWGRTTSGQAILLDSVICDIYDEIHGT